VVFHTLDSFYTPFFYLLSQSTYAHLRTPGKTPRLAPTTPVRDSATVVALQEEIAELKSLLAEAGNNVTRAEVCLEYFLYLLV